MLTTERERKICEKYSCVDEETGKVRCYECPLRKGEGYDFRCKANSHYDRKKQSWEYDPVEPVIFM